MGYLKRQNPSKDLKLKEYSQKMIRTLISSLLICLILFSQSFAQEDSVIATVDGKRVTQNDADYLIIGKILPLQERINAIRKVALENLITNLVLKKEAQKKGMSVKEFKRSLTDVNVTVSSGEVESAYLENREAFGLMNTEEAKERVRLDLISQAKMRAYGEAIKKLKENSEVAYFENAFTPKVFTDYKGPTLGNKNAKISIVEFSDFRCPHCRNSQEVTKQLLAKYGNEIKLVFKHLPLQPNSHILARASVCADNQGRFWEYHDQLFKIENLSEKVPAQLAKKLKLDVAGFEKCMVTDESLSAVFRDQNEAKRLGIDSTPSFIINGELIRGAANLQTFIQIVEKQFNN